MGTGASLHIGAERRAGDDAFSTDARRFAAFADARGFAVAGVYTGEVTPGTIASAVLDVAGRLGRGDTFLLTYSGHGQRPLRRRTPGDWVLSRRTELLTHDYLGRALLTRFAAGVRIIIVADACYSGALEEPCRG